MTWMSGDGFRNILFNRDERNSRARERPPALRRPAAGPAYLAPTDPDSGGTWIAANEYGLVCAVLNHYAAAGGDTPPPGTCRWSRGNLPSGAMMFRDAAQVREWIAALGELPRLRPFLLVALGGVGDGVVARWDGRVLETATADEGSLPLTTSSWNPDEVLPARRRLFREIAGNPPALGELLDFHSLHLDGRPAHGPAMIRSDAHTRSLTVVRIGRTDVSMRHQEFAPESAAFLPPSIVSLPRRVPS
ncbi:MAG: NRDE family protein [Puniceicoccaceae bacterium]